MNSQMHEQNIQLKTSIIDAFQAFYYQFKTHKIYAFVLEVDASFTLQSFLASTEASIFDETEVKQQYLLEADKWIFNKWKYRKKFNFDNNLNSDSFSQNVNQEQIISKIFENVFPDQTHQDKLDFLIERYQHAILFLSKVYQLDLNNILFLIHSPTQKNLAADLAQSLNPPSSLLFEFLAHAQISKQDHPIQTIKLKQVDKDLLIDLAQIVNFIEPYDSLTTAHQAYLLTLDAGFAHVHTHIQALVKNIAAMNDPILALDKNEVLSRINQFYKI